MNTPDNPQAEAKTTPMHVPPAGPDLRPGHNKRGAQAVSAGPGTVDPLLFIHYTTHSDLEQQRVATENRLRILTATEPDDDGVMRGFGLDHSHPDVARLAGIASALRALEHDAELGLKRAMRRCALHPWVATQVGLGDKQVARLLGAIGDPYWHLAEDRPRTVSELWAYSGLHVLPSGHVGYDAHLSTAAGAALPADHEPPDTQERTVGGNQTSDPARGPLGTQIQSGGVAARRSRGQKANWSTEAKTRAYLCATSCIKQAASPYRAVYLGRREHTATTHPDWTPGHSHNDALRIASKAILRDLWRESRRLHGHVDELEVAS